MATSIELHRSSLYLKFSPECLPYAEVAQFYLSTKPRDTLVLGCDSNLLMPSPSLIIPKGIYADNKTTLNTKIAILRLFDRIANKSRTVETNYKINETINSFKEGADWKKILNPKTKYLVGESISMADLLGWDFALKHEIDTVWTKSISKTPELLEAKRAVDKVVNAIPKVDYYKFHVMKQVALATNADPQDISKAALVPKFKEQGDFAVPIPALKLQGNPAELAKTIADQIKPDEFISKSFSKGVFVHFEFNHAKLRPQLVMQAIALGKNYGNNSSGLGKFAVCEYSSPNIAKPFHLGHLRSTIIGSFVEKLLNSSGWKTVSINYLGDWGKQYGLLAVGFEKYGDEQKLVEDPIRHLFEIYVKINADAKENEEVHDVARAYFKQMEDGDEKALAQWKRFRDLSIAKYADTYRRLNVKFDVYSGESQYSLDQMMATLNDLDTKGLLTPLDGARVVDLTPFKLGTAVIEKKDGSLLYLSRDIAAAQDRFNEYNFDKMIYCVGTQQDHHFRQLFKVLELMGKTWLPRCEHVAFGLIKSDDGNMSTRNGTVVFLSQILDSVQEEMHNLMKKNEQKYSQIEDPERVADIVGMSAVVIQDMGARRVKDYSFDWNRMFSFEGDTGPYLQYAHARMCSIERQAERFNITPERAAQLDYSVLVEPEAAKVLDLIGSFPSTILEVVDSLEPCQLVNYALKLSHAVSSAYKELWVHGREDHIAEPRLAMYFAARICLGNALQLLGLEPLERM